MILKNALGHKSKLIYLPTRLISIQNAQRIFREEKMADESIKDDSQLKKIYLRLAKKYHPDVAKTGNKIKFQQIKQAYDRLLAEKEGYTLTEEDL